MSDSTKRERALTLPETPVAKQKRASEESSEVVGGVVNVRHVARLSGAAAEAVLKGLAGGEPGAPVQFKPNKLGLLDLMLPSTHRVLAGIFDRASGLVAADRVLELNWLSRHLMGVLKEGLLNGGPTGKSGGAVSRAALHAASMKATEAAQALLSLRKMLRSWSPELVASVVPGKVELTDSGDAEKTDG